MAKLTLRVLATIALLLLVGGAADALLLTQDPAAVELAALPEPSTLALAFGLSGLVWFGRRRC